MPLDTPAQNAFGDDPHPSLPQPSPNPSGPPVSCSSAVPRTSIPRGVHGSTLARSSITIATFRLAFRSRDFFDSARLPPSAGETVGGTVHKVGAAVQAVVGAALDNGGTMSQTGALPGETVHGLGEARNHVAKPVAGLGTVQSVGVYSKPGKNNLAFCGSFGLSAPL